MANSQKTRNTCQINWIYESYDLFCFEMRLASIKLFFKNRWAISNYQSTNISEISDLTFFQCWFYKNQRMFHNFFCYYKISIQILWNHYLEGFSKEQYFSCNIRHYATFNGIMCLHGLLWDDTFFVLKYF